MNTDRIQAAARDTDPSESWLAAGTVNRKVQMRHLLDVLEHMDRQGQLPATDGIIAVRASRMGYADSEQGLRSRRHEAVEIGLVKRADRQGISPTGRRASRWTLTDKGREAMRTMRRTA